MKKNYYTLRSKILKFFFILLIVLLALGVAAFVPENIPPADNDLSNKLDHCQCVSLAFDAAPLSIKQLVKWTSGISFDDQFQKPLPEFPIAYLWDAYKWPENIMFYGPQFDPTLDWAGAIDHNPTPGAIVVYSANSTTTWWTVNQTQSSFPLEGSGHIAVVTSYNATNNTINTNDRNWGTDNAVECGVIKERKNVDVYLDMLFIHTPIKITPPNTNPKETKQTFKTQFTAQFPWRNIWVSSRSKFDLLIDGKPILQQDRPQTWSTFSKTNLFLAPPATHSVVINWTQVGNDPTPEFSQTWWPNVMTFAAEPDPPADMEINYTYFLKPQPLLKGQPASLAIVAGATLPFEINSVDVFAGQTKLGSIQGHYGMFSIPVDSLPTGHSQLTLMAIVPDWKGTITKQTIDIDVVEPAGYAPPTIVPTNTPEPTITEGPQPVSKLRGPVRGLPSRAGC